TQLRDLLDKPNQDKWMQVKDVRWLNPPEGEAAAKKSVNEFIYEITYATPSGKDENVLVSLTTAPDGTSVEEMKKDVMSRASHLPDSSVEQVFLAGESYPDRKSKRFTIRTTEKEKELVQVALDRLLRDGKGVPLMASAKMSFAKVTSPRVKLDFSE